MSALLYLASDAPSPRPGSPITVILADLHAAVRRNLRLLLEREEGVEVLAEAADLSAVTRHVHEHVPHVLVLGLRMPNCSSVETIRRLRPQAPDTEIVVLTMEASPTFAQLAIEAGAIGFVLKDHADDELLMAVRCAAVGDEYISPRVTVELEALRRSRSQRG